MGRDRAIMRSEARLGHLTRETVGILIRAIRSFSEAGATETAASLAYYAFFSFFPLLLVLISIGSAALESEAVQKQVFALLTQAIPGSAGFIESTVTQVLRQRGTVGLAGLLGLLWSASGGFSVLVKHINRAWPDTATRNSIWRRVYGLGIILILVVLFGLWFVSNTLLDLLPRLEPLGALGDMLSATLRGRILATLIPIFASFVMFLVLYRWVPNREVSWGAAAGGAAAAALGWELASNAFRWYLSSGFARFSLVYGSLGAIVVFLLWVYLSSLVALFGAHLAAAIDLHLPPEE